MSEGWLLLIKILILFYVLLFVAGLIIGIVKITVDYTQNREPEKAKAEPSERLSAADADRLKYIKGLLKDIRGRAGGGEAVKIGGYWYDVLDVENAIRTIDNLLNESESGRGDKR